MKTREELENFYNELDNKFEGYIQMSDRKLEAFDIKPSWNSIHKNNNFIHEACLFDGDRSIMIRQVNDKFIIIDKNISEIKNSTQEIFFAKDNKKVKIIQEWEAIEDQYCENMKVLKPSLQLFAGFKGDQS